MNIEHNRIRGIIIFVVMSVMGFLIGFLKKPKK